MPWIRNTVFLALGVCFVARAVAQFETRTKVSVLSTDAPNSPVSGDFNGDGNLDFAVTSVYGKSVAVVISNGDGTFRAPSYYRAGENPTALATADLNHDGKLDLVVGNYGSGTTLAYCWETGMERLRLR